MKNNRGLNSIANLALKVAKINVNSASWIFIYQPKMPDKLKNPKDERNI